MSDQTTDLHEHRRPEKADFEGKTVARFEPDADNVWRFWFTDGTAFAVQSESDNGIGYMELCEVCVECENAGEALKNADPQTTDPRLVTAQADEDRATIMHALGLDVSMRPFRKHYIAPPNGPVRRRFDRLERMGLFIRFGEPDRVGQCFHVTTKGANLVGVKLP